ncbi:ATP-binding protein [Azospirillum rugosum]|uniref:histidine kinase n=1 Tax=Azospirillum rugosum TaxID=416170 RepID=A0ABS4SWZ9_9PROT|nr:ATP-binding protein [Azospirillum rugosum]MBP2295915.1 two-component system phosphate regulon sensor histidine kinase PhoR [Azospirillum rugosum]MDQ0530172.1 two-component system phosphate regulon sensor histidine kinase PhoR [Azospirillum rugosum]
MSPKVMPPLRLIAGALLMLGPLAASLYLLLHGGLITPGVAVGVGLPALAGVVVILRTQRRDTRAVTDYVARLTDEPSTPVPPLASPASVRGLTAAVARLHRVMTGRVEQAQAQLEANESILEALHDPLVLVGADRQVVRANQAARGLFGDRILNRDLAASLRNPSVLEAVDAVLGGAASRILEFSLPVPVERMFEVRVKPFQRRLPRPVPDENALVPEDPAPAPPVTGRMVILTLHDITALRRSEQMRADFIANASHELRTPLSSLLGFIETLRGPARDDLEAHERFLSIMHDQASRMARLVNDLLSLSRIELDEHMPPAGQVDVLDRLDGVIAALELKAASRRIRLKLEAPERVPPVVGDEDQLTQVFQNLVSNAIKYTRENTDVTVAVSLADGAMVGFTSAVPLAQRNGRGHPMVAVAVRDQGEGIARTHLPRLTERFYRVDAARSRAMGGTGLGLAIVKHILNRHRGRLTIESAVGVGSTFTVYLPAASDAALPAAEPARRQA